MVATHPFLQHVGTGAVRLFAQFLRVAAVLGQEVFARDAERNEGNLVRKCRVGVTQGHDDRIRVRGLDGFELAGIVRAAVIAVGCGKLVTLERGGRRRRGSGGSRSCSRRKGCGCGTGRRARRSHRRRARRCASCHARCGGCAAGHQQAEHGKQKEFQPKHVSPPGRNEFTLSRKYDWFRNLLCCNHLLSK